MKGLRKLDCIMFRVKDLDAAARFYTDVMGLSQIWQDDAYQMIGLAFPESDAEVVIHTNSDIPSPDMSFLFDVVEDFVAEFRGKGYRVGKEPFEVRSGKCAVLADPDGNAINIIDLKKFGGAPRYTSNH